MRRLPGSIIGKKLLPQEKNPQKTPCRKEPQQLREDLYRAFGVDLTRIPAPRLIARGSKIANR